MLLGQDSVGAISAHRQPASMVIAAASAATKLPEPRRPAAAGCIGTIARQMRRSGAYAALRGRPARTAARQQLFVQTAGLQR